MKLVDTGLTFCFKEQHLLTSTLTEYLITSLHVRVVCQKACSHGAGR